MKINPSIFKEYDIRGRYPDEINEEVAYLVGRGYGSYLKELKETKCVVGRDNRLSGPSLHEEMVKGIRESGIDVIDYGIVTTPMHYLTRRNENCYGITITASHNPKDDNGFKFSFDKWANARGKMIYDFRDYIEAGNFSEGNGSYSEKNICEDFIEYMKNNVDMGSKKLKVVVDPGNGTGAIICKECFALFPNLDVTYICDESDGRFPNHHPDPAVEENLTMLKEKVLEVGADIGVSYDGDADRIGFINNLGEFVAADQFMIMVVRHLLPSLNNKTILYDVKCTKSLEDEINKLGGIPYCYRTGTSYTEMETKEKEIEFGGEFSGHIFFNDRDETLGCGIYSGLRMIEILSKTEQPMSELLNGITEYLSTPEIKITSANEKKFGVVAQVLEYVKEKNYEYLDIDGVKVKFNDGWALVRASNTGPNVLLRFEAQTSERLKELKQEFQTLVEKLNQ